MKIKPTLLFLLPFVSHHLFAQDQDMLDLIKDDKPQKEYVEAAFKSSRVIMSHSMEMLKPGVLDFRILHRFFPVNTPNSFGGFDHANIRLGLDYAISKNLTVGIGRTSYLPRKDADGFIKYRVIQQAKGEKQIPISLVAVAGITARTAKWDNTTQENHFSSRLGYYGQVIIGRKFSEAFTLQLMPSIVHRNLVPSTPDPNDTYAVGTGGRIKISRRTSFNFDYYYVINKDKSSTTYNPLSLGFDIETGGHVFQLHFTNAVGMNERTFITDTINDWGKGDIQFGFNISRAFQIKKKKT